MCDLIRGGEIMWITPSPRIWRSAEFIESIGPSAGVIEGFRFLAPFPALIADLAEHALVRVERLLVCVEWPHWPLPPRLLEFAERGQRQADRTGNSCLHR